MKAKKKKRAKKVEHRPTAAEFIGNLKREENLKEFAGRFRPRVPGGL